MNNKGFTLMEAIIALIFIGVFSVSLLKAQWRLNQMTRALIHTEQSTTQHGFTLTELLIAMCISSILVLVAAKQAGMMQQHAHWFWQTREEITERAWLEDLVQGQVEQAGFTGCVGMKIQEAIELHAGKSAITVHYFEPIATDINEINANNITLNKTDTIAVGSKRLELRDCWTTEPIALLKKVKNQLFLKRPLMHSFPYPKLAVLGTMHHVTLRFKQGILYMSEDQVDDKLSQYLEDLSFSLIDGHLEVDWRWRSGLTKHQILELPQVQLEQHI